MKHQYSKITSKLFYLFIIFPFIINAQKSNEGLEKNFEFNNSTETQVISFTIDKQTKEIEIKFEGEINQEEYEEKKRVLTQND